MAEGVNEHDIKANRLPPIKMDEVIARAQRILDLRGRPPYSPIVFGFSAGGGNPALSEDEAILISEFVHHWLPFLTEKEKKP